MTITVILVTAGMGVEETLEVEAMVAEAGASKGRGQP